MDFQLFPLLSKFSVRTRVNRIEAIYERLDVNVKVKRGSTFTFARDLPLFYSRGYNLPAYASKNYVTVEIHPNATMPLVHIVQQAC